MKKLTKKTITASSKSIKTWDELTSEQQDSILKDWYKYLGTYMMDWIAENASYIYEEDVSQLIEEFERAYPGLQINSDKIYWESGSQGWYPEWNVSQIFDGSYVKLSATESIGIWVEEISGRRYAECCIGLEDVWYEDDTSDGYDSESWDEIKENLDHYFKEKGKPFTQEDINLIDSYETGINDFMERLRAIIKDYTYDYFGLADDDDYIKDTMDNNPDAFEFVLDESGKILRHL